jgi:hypothetical protein
MFWTDKWLNGQCIADLAPSLFAAISQRRRKQRTVQSALLNQAWIVDIQGSLSVDTITEYIQLWDLLDEVQLQQEVDDTHKWRFDSSRQYSAKSAYGNLFLGATLFQPYERIWQTWAPPKCKLFMWLAAHKRCWTSDRLARRGLPHPEHCPLCDQEDETLDHLLVACVFTRQFWYLVLQQVGMHSLAPQPTDLIFDEWWEKASMTTFGLTKRGLNSLIILGAWTIWNHRNKCVFEGASPNMVESLILLGEDRCLWMLAGARGLSHLMAPLLGS